MKKFYAKNFAYGAAALLVGAVGLTGCSSDDELTNVNPTYDGESVKAQFAINVPYGGGQGTRMTDVNTQNSNNFLGMKELRLVAFDGDPASDGTLKSIITTLGTINSGELSATQSSKIYSNVNVPVQTDHFLFYAQAIGNNGFENGAIEPNIDGVSGKGDITFQLVKTNNGAVTSDSQAGLLLEVLNAVDADDVWDGTLDTDLSALRTSLHNLKAGSANNVRLALQNLYNAVERWAIGTDDDNKKAASAIRDAITAAKYGAGTNTQVFALKSPGTSSPYELTTTLSFPVNLNLPDGAVKMQYTNSEFSYEASTENLTGLAGFDYTKVCYPAALYYFVNTDIATSNQSLQNTEWPTTTTNWTSDASAPWLAEATKNNWGTEVTASTQSIALKKNINYGVAGLKLTVKCAKGSLPDNGGAGTPNYIPVASAGFPVTGLLIGGQPTQTGWNFLPKGTSFDFTVYDNDIHDVYAKENASAGTNYTLLMPNKQTQAATVNFAIELENNTGHEFRGQDGVVPVGGKFYLVGKLDPSATSGVNKPSGVTDVFMPDYQTVANVTITSLANAYNTIPDLRATQMELGLSVDLTWETGITFDVNIGGNN